jgi:hypothetical protein
MKERNLLSVAAFIGQAADLATIAKGVMPDVRQIQKALPYYKEAVFAFTQAASNEISNIDSEEAKVDDLKSEENYTDWLSSVTKFVESILYGTNK